MEPITSITAAVGALLGLAAAVINLAAALKARKHLRAAALLTPQPPAAKCSTPDAGSTRAKPERPKKPGPRETARQ
jgi:hypothetical protein